MGETTGRFVTALAPCGALPPAGPASSAGLVHERGLGPSARVSPASIPVVPGTPPPGDQPEIQAPRVERALSPSGAAS